MNSHNSNISGEVPKQECTDTPRERGFVFVQILFSLAAAEIAKQASDRFLQDYELGRFLDSAPAYFHLLIATVLVTTSWIGWSRSYKKHSYKLDKVFSINFIRLLLDIALVTLYFILIKSVEIRDDNLDMAPSAKPEAFFITLIFIIYFIWDVLSKKSTKDLVYSVFCMVIAALSNFVICDTESIGKVVIFDIFLIIGLFAYRYFNEYKYKPLHD